MPSLRRLPRRRLRTLLLSLLLLVGGAAVNIAVAWGCVYRHFYSLPQREWMTDAAFPAPLDVDQWVVMWRVFPNGPQRVEMFWGTDAVYIGYRETHATAKWHDRDNNYKSCEADGHAYHAGWPAYAMIGRSGTLVDSSIWQGCFAWVNSDNEWVGPFPYDPIWPGFAINTVFYAAILWGGWLLFAVPFAVRRRRRIKRGLCPACAYPVGTNDVCTECGTPKPVTVRPAP